jgi:hypothetical protein
MIINKSGIDNFIKRRISPADEVGEMYEDIQELANNFPFSALLDVCDTVQYFQAKGVKEILQEIPPHTEVTSQRGLIIYHHQSEGGEITLYIDANIRLIYFDFDASLTQRMRSKIGKYIANITKSEPPLIYINFLRTAKDRGLTEEDIYKLLTKVYDDICDLIRHITEVANALR